MNFKGFATLNKELNHSQNLFGELSDVEGRILQVIDRNSSGDCMCLLPSQDNLISIDNRDIKLFMPTPEKDLQNPLDMILSVLKQTKSI